MQSSCRNKAQCRKCSGPHNHRVCPEDNKKRCAKCNGEHEAWSRECVFRQREMNRIEGEIKATPRFHRDGRQTILKQQQQRPSPTQQTQQQGLIIDEEGFTVMPYTDRRNSGYGRTEFNGQRKGRRLHYEWAQRL